MATTADDYDLIVMLAADSAGCTLAKTPQKDNWVDKAGHLPPYICAIARAMVRGGKPVSSAIAIAVSRAKTWAAGGAKVNADTRAKAAAAVAQWEALKAKSKAGKLVKASAVIGESIHEYVMLSNIPSFNVNIVTSAWDAKERIRREEWRAEHKSDGDGYEMQATAGDFYPYRWIRETWTDYIIVQTEDKSGLVMEKIPYSVDATTKDVTFGTPVEVKQAYVEIEDPDLTEEEKELLGLSADGMVKLSSFGPDSPIDRIRELYKNRT